MIESFDYIKELFEIIKKRAKLDNNYCIIFVYNSPDTMSDSIHESECVFDEEKNMILSSFRKIALNVLSIDGEDEFFKQIPNLKIKYKYILVYSMAQNLKGDGRRSLIPLLCDYYGLINIGADFISCALGRSKDIMYNLLAPMGFPFPKTFYIYQDEDIERTLNYIKTGKWLLKPNNESSSIGMEVFEYHAKSEDATIEHLINYRKNHPVFCIQEFIDGEEVAVPILKINNKYYCPGISQVDFPEGKNYINYDMVALGTYGYFEYLGPIKDKLIEISSNVSRVLKLTAMSRIDFRINNNIPYIEDIGANPTISEDNGVNEIYRSHLGAESWCVYAILVYAALIEHKLFEPSFYHSPNNRREH